MMVALDFSQTYSNVVYKAKQHSISRQ